MSSPYIGEIRIFAGNFPPVGWAFCDGSLFDIAEYDTLFNLIGTTYGGDGQSTFALPDLRGRVPVHMGPTYQLAETGGAEQVTLSSTQIPSHTHSLTASTDVATAPNPANAVTGQSATKLYRSPSNVATMNASTIASEGGSQPHENMQPFVVVNYIISLFGIYPSPT